MRLKQPGFGVLEIIVVLGIVAFLASMILTLTRRDTTTTDLKKIEHAFAGMLITAQQETLVRHTVMRIHIKSERNTNQSFTLEQADTSLNEKNIFIPARSIGGTNSFTLPSTWKIKAIYQGSQDLLSQATKGTRSVFCHVIPSGIIPSLLIHLEATKTKQVATLRTEPFQKTITLYNSLIAPPKKPRGSA